MSKVARERICRVCGCRFMSRNQADCLPCLAAQYRAKQAAKTHEERSAEWARRWARTRPRIVEVQRASYRRNRPHYREKDAVRRKAQWAVKTGKLTKLPCEVCGDVKVQAHHDDYAKPLEVRWLCRRHHVEHHQQDGLWGKLAGGPAPQEAEK